MTKEANMNIEDLTPEQMEKAKACKTPGEILALAKEEGYELSDEQLEGLSGGEIVASWGCDDHCWKDGDCFKVCYKVG